MNRINLWLGLALITGMNISTPLQATGDDNNSLALNLIYQRTLPSIVSITVVDHNGQKRRGSGFFVDERGLFVTSFANVQDAQRITMRTHDGWLYDVTDVIALAREHDLALLRAPIAETRVLNLISPTARLVNGYPAVVVGSGSGLTWHIASGAVASGTRDSTHAELDNTDLIAFTSTIKPGTQGGPLLNQYGQVMGVIRASQHPDSHWAVHADHVRELIARINAMPLSATWVSIPKPPTPPAVATLAQETSAPGAGELDSSGLEENADPAESDQPAETAGKLETAGLNASSALNTEPATDKQDSPRPPKPIEHITQVKRLAWSTVSTEADPSRVCPPMISEHLRREFGMLTVANDSNPQASMHLSGTLNTDKECNMWGCFDGYRLDMSFSIVNTQGTTLFRDLFKVDEDDVEEACEELAEDIVDEVEDYF